jgi:hypothetical protein
LEHKSFLSFGTLGFLATGLLRLLEKETWNSHDTFEVRQAAFIEERSIAKGVFAGRGQD